MMNRVFCVSFVLLQFLVALCSCGEQPALVGTYEATNPQDPEHVVVLVLQSGGNGSWSFADEEVPVRWEQRKEQIWLHHKGGGILAGKISGAGEIEIVLPGIGSMLFKRQKITSAAGLLNRLFTWRESRVYNAPNCALVCFNRNLVEVFER